MNDRFRYVWRVKGIVESGQQQQLGVPHFLPVSRIYHTDWARGHILEVWLYPRIESEPELTLFAFDSYGNK